jgi:hypothetical protein
MKRKKRNVSGLREYIQPMTTRKTKCPALLAGDGVAELLADLALDRERRDGQAEQPKAEERARREVGAQRGVEQPGVVRAPVRKTCWPSAAGGPARGSSRFVTWRSDQTGIVPSLERALPRMPCP